MKKLFASLSALVGIASSSATVAAETPEHVVIVTFMYGSKNLDTLFELESKLEAAIEEAKVGEYDGNEVAVDGSDGTLYMYGPDADKLFIVVKPILESVPFMRGAQVTRRYGPPKDGVREVVVKL